MRMMCESIIHPVRGSSHKHLCPANRKDPRLGQDIIGKTDPASNIEAKKSL
jgi:hypothetical protein